MGRVGCETKANFAKSHAFEKGFEFTTLAFETSKWRVYKSVVKQSNITYEEK